MNNKFFNWVVLIVSGLLIMGQCYVLITDLSFSLHRKQILAAERISIQACMIIENHNLFTSKEISRRI
jgi:hypothetical protein